MPKWQDELYIKYKAETIISIIAVSLIGFLWKYLPDVLPFLATKQIGLLYLLKVTTCLLISILILGLYIIVLHKRIKKLKTPTLELVDLSEYKN